MTNQWRNRSIKERLHACVGCAFASLQICIIGLVYFALSIHGLAQVSALRIDELMLSNGSTLSDEYGKYPDWVEIVNTGDQVLDLRDHGLSTNPEQPFLYRFPAYKLDPGKRVIVFCSGRDDQTTPTLPKGDSVMPSLDGVQLHLDASFEDAFILHENGGILLWVDKSGQSHHVRQPEAHKAPVFSPMNPRGIPAVFFDGDDDFFELDSLNNAQTVFWVGAEHPFATNDFRPILGHTIQIPMVRGANHFLLHNLYSTHWLGHGVSLNGHPVDAVITPAPVSNSMLTFRSQAPRFINTLGTDRFIDNQFWHGWFCELIMFDRILSSDEEAVMHEYLMDKWGLPTRFLHAPFKLPNETGLMVLTNPDGARLDAVTLKATSRDVSLQRVHGGNVLHFVSDPSPGKPPTETGYMGILDPVSSSILAGTYDQPVSVELRHQDSDVVIRYTLNGDEPGEESTLYTEPITIAETSVLKAKAFREGYLSGETMTASYIIQFPTTIPVVSISGPPDGWFGTEKGIYTLGENAEAERPHDGANFWKAWEREIQFEWFEPTGERTFQQIAGAKIHGGWSRASGQKSVALIARSRYGKNRFKGQFFNSDEEVAVKQLLLRNAGNDWTLTMLRDPLGQSLMGDIGLDTQPYRPVNVFINGEYFGLHNLRQRANEHFLSAKTGVPDDQIDLVASSFESLSGDHTEALAFIRWVAQQDTSDPAFEDALEQRMDVDNFLDYIIGETCIDNFDWPNNNVRFWKERKPEARWRWMPFDLDGAFNPLNWNARVNTIRRIINFEIHSASKIFIAVTENEALFRRFILRFQHRLNNTFSTHNMLARLEEMAEKIRPEMPRHIERWKGSVVGRLTFPNSIEEWESHLDVIRRFAQVRPEVIMNFAASEFDLQEPVSIRLNLPQSESGEILIDGLPIVRTQNEPWEGRFFQEYDLTFSAIPKNGFVFKGWAEIDSESPDITINPSQIKSLTPIFEQIGDPMPTGTEGKVHISEVMYHPSTQRPNEEFIELTNVDDHPVQLGGWSFDRGVSFEFPNVVLEPGSFVVVAADPVAFQLTYPDAPKPLGPWKGKLRNSGESIRLRNHLNKTVDSLEFADEGDWSERVRGNLMRGHRGWIWSNAHDGGGHSLERISLEADSNQGQNWAASKLPKGTPGLPNSINNPNQAPFINQVKHSPAVPTSDDPVWISAELKQYDHVTSTAEIWFRVDGETDFQMVPLKDDGQGKDQKPGDGLFGAQLQAFPHGTVVEFYITARNANGEERNWPKPTPEGQVANALFQVDDMIYPSSDPIARVITTEAERLELEKIGGLPWIASSDAQMNATFIMVENGDEEIRYQSGFRIRGTTSRELNPKNRRINFPSDDPWRGRSSVIYNAINVPSQILGSALFQFGGVPVTRSRPVIFLENNTDHAATGFPQFGRYAQMEALGSEFTNQHFEGDGNGNLYRPYGYGNLEYLGDNPQAYQEWGYYVKSTNVEEDDWSDLIRLTHTLAESTDAAYETETALVANTEEWLRYFALDTMLGNMETSFANGGAGDYAFYIGEKDQRAILLPYDLDSLLGMAVGGVNMSLFRATAKEVPARFLKSPGFAQRYYNLLQHFADTLFAPESINPLLGQMLGDWTSPAFVERIRKFIQDRRNFVLSQIPRSLGARVNLPLAEPNYLRYYKSDSDKLTLEGHADVLETHRVLVQGMEAHWSVWDGKWFIHEIPLHAGVNEIVVQALDADGVELEQLRLRFFYESSKATRFGGVLEEDTIWDASKSPIQVESDLTIPPGVELQILPGTSVEFLSGAGMIIQGQLKVQGTPDARVYFSAQRFAEQRWGGLKFQNSMEDNELSYTTIEWTVSPGIHLNHSKLDMTGIRWIGAYNSFIISIHSTLSVRNSIFPNVTHGEPIAGIGIPEGGYWIIEGNEFGTTTGYADIIDFTGGKHPGPIAQFLNNRFNGGPDDGLDLDGGDAYVAGNVFMNFQKANGSTSESHAVATGLYGGVPSNITVVRNVFYNNEHDILLKERSSARVLHNTFIDSTVGTISLRELTRRTQPPSGLYMEGNIIRTDKVFHAFDEIMAANPAFQLEINHSIIPDPWTRFGEGNLPLTPVFQDEDALDFRLVPNAGIHEIGPLQLEPGAYVPPGIAFNGIPWSTTTSQSAQIQLGGPGVVEYRYRLDQGDWSEVLSIDAKLNLENLNEGPHQLEFIEKDVAGNWRSSESPIKSSKWIVDSKASPIRLNEVFANPSTSNSEKGLLWEYIEVINTGNRAHVLNNYSLTDDPDFPAKFTFPEIAISFPGQHTVMGEQGAYSLLGLELPFRLRDSGEGVYLFRSVDDTYELVDHVVFGWQAEGWSIGRDGMGKWVLSNPTPGESHRGAQYVGSPNSIEFNEWTPLFTENYPKGFLELANNGNAPVDISGWTLGRMPHSFEESMTMPALSFIAPGQYMLLEPGNDMQDLPSRLNKESDLWYLRQTNGELVDQFWYANPKQGFSFSFADSNKEALVQKLPTAGTHNGEEPSEQFLLINEIAADNRQFQNALSNFADWVELRNLSTRPISLAGYSLTDDAEVTSKWTFPPNATIEAKGYFVVWLDGKSPADDRNTGFSIKSSGDELWLFGPRSQGGTLLDYVSFGIQIPGHTLGRNPQSLEWQLNQPTPILPNSATTLGNSEQLKVNEWMADPISGSDWFEIYNPSERPIALEGIQVSDDPSELNKHVFPPLTFIGTGSDAYLLLEANGKKGGTREADFKLSANGETIVLSNASDVIIDQVRFDEQEEGLSQGRWPDGTDDIFDFILSSSPGTGNTLDTDLDGLPDLWEVAHGFDPDSNGDALTDPDGDNSSNHHEYQANTNPLDPTSVFSFKGLRLLNGNWQLEFEATEGRGYQVQTTGKMGEAWETIWEVDPLLESRLIEVNLPADSILGYLRLRALR